MTHLLVFDLINSLDAEEAEEFRVFLRSDYLMKGLNREDMESLLGFLRKAHLEGKSESLDKDRVYANVFPGKALVRNKLEKLASDLSKALRKFLLIKRYFSQENEKTRQLDWLKELRVRDFAKRHLLALDKVKKEMQNDSVESLEQFQMQQLFAQEEHEWHSIYNARGDQKLPGLIEHLDGYYYNYRTELINRLLLQHKHTILDPAIVRLIHQPWEVPPGILNNSALLQITWAIHALLKAETPTAEDLQVLLKSIKEKEAILSPEAIKAFYTYLRNLCAFLIDFGQVEFYPVFHAIQKDNLLRGYFYFEGKIIPNSCLSITRTAIQVGAIDWAKQFIEAHKDRIFDEGETQEYYRMNVALCLFAEKKYDEALELISFDTTFSLKLLLARRLELMIYYELRSDLLPYKIDAFSMFIRRSGQKVLSKDSFELHLNFINLLRQISLSVDIVDPQRSRQLIQRIQGKKKVAERKWLLEKSGELAGKRNGA